MPTPFTLTGPLGEQADLLADITTTPEGGAVRLGLSLSLAAIRPPAGSGDDPVGTVYTYDTPGIFAPKRRLDRAMVKSAWEGAGDADGIVDRLDRCPAAPGPAAGQGCPDTDRDLDGCRAHRACLPAQSRANCQATRPLREPRSSAHWSASPRAPATAAGGTPNSASQWFTTFRYSSWLKG